MFHFTRSSALPVAALFVSAVWLPLNAQTATAPAVSITVSASPNPSVFAAPVTFTVMVAAASAAGPVPTGTVTATLLGPIFLGVAILDGTGKAVITVPGGPTLLIAGFGLPAGSDSITFAYSGDAKYKAAQSTTTQFVNKANSSTTAAIVGSAQPLHLSATVKIAEPSAANAPFSLPGNLSSDDPTGTVQFFNGTTLLGTATLSPSGLFTSTATLAVVTVPASLTAVYSGDSNYNGSTSSPATGPGQRTVGLTITPSVNPSTFAQPVTFAIAVASATTGGGTPTGTVTASLLGIFNLGSATLSGGQATITVPSASSATASIPWGLPAGSNSITFSYSGDANYLAASSTSTEIVDKAATTTAAALSATALTNSITATVSIDEPSVSLIGFAIPGANAGIGNPTGSVQFLNGSTVIGTAMLSPSGHFQATATLNVTPPYVSTGVLTAVYGGDANYNGSTSPPATIPNLPAVTVGVQSSVNPSTFAEPVTFSIKVATATAGNVTPTGTVQATVAGQNLGSATLDASGSATITAPSQSPHATPGVPFGLGTGSNAITVSYSGDANFASGQSSFNQLVNHADTAATVILPPVAIGATSYPVMATVSINESSVSTTGFLIPSPGNLSTSPTGSVSFFDGPTLLGTANLTTGTTLFRSTATFTVSSVPVSFRAVYYGDGNYNGSSSQSQSSGNGTATVTLASSNNPSVYGAPFTIQATVAATTAGGPNPTGTVQFFDGGQSLNGSATLDSSGHATLSIPIPMASPLVCVVTCPPGIFVMVLPAGANVITAQYSGDANYAAAKSTSPLTQQITKAPTTTTTAAVVRDPVVGGNPPGITVFSNVADAQPPSGGPYHFILPGGSGLVDGDPTGAVAFYNGATFIGNAALTPNTSANVTSTAELNLIGFTTTGSFSATYAGDANFQGSGSPTSAPTSVKLTSSPNPSSTGQSVTLTATISTTTATPAPTGTMTFLDGTRRCWVQQPPPEAPRPSPSHSTAPGRIR